MRTSVKCPECRFANWSDAESCKRCLAPLAPQPSFGAFNPMHKNLDDMSYPSYSSYMPNAAGGVTSLAGRGARLIAYLLDVAVFLPLVLIGFYAGWMEAAAEAGATPDQVAAAAPVISMGMLSLVLFYIFGVGIAQIYLLTIHGQTVGKKLMGVRVVRQDTQENGGFFTNIVLRSIVPGLISAVPIVGALFSLIDLLFIFSDDRRCLHDRIAGTIVVKA